MGKTLSQADARAIERLAREVAGIAFAEVETTAGGSPVLRLWLWQGAPQDETVGNVEVALREMGLEVRTGDVAVAGIARGLTARPGHESESVRVIDLGDGIWATEPVEPALPPLLPPPADAATGLPVVATVTVTRGRAGCTARVELDRPDGSRFAAEASGPDSAERARRAVCEAAAAAASAALSTASFDVAHVGIAEPGTPCAVVVLRSSADGRVAAGAAIIGEDQSTAFARATLQAAFSL